MTFKAPDFNDPYRRGTRGLPYDPIPPKQSTSGEASDESNMPPPHPPTRPSFPPTRRGVPVPPPPPPDPHAAIRARNQAMGDAVRRERAASKAAGTFVPRHKLTAPPAPPVVPPNLPPREDLRMRQQRQLEAQRMALRGLDRFQ